MNHEGTIGRHGLGHALKICLLDGGIERQNTIMDLWIDPVAEFDNGADSPAGR